MRVTAYDRGNFGEYRRYLEQISESNTDEMDRLSANLRRALKEELTERQLLLVTMYYLENKKMTDIAAELGICQSTVSRTLSRARHRLGRVLRYGARALLDSYGCE